MEKFICKAFLLLTVLSFLTRANSVWPRPLIVPLPDAVTGVALPVISLNGTWKFTMTPPANFWLNSVDHSSWRDIQVPGELQMQGFAIARNTEYPCKKTVAIPADFSGKRILLRFDGVYSRARVWVNGTFVRSHYGGFTSWNCDITSLVTPGQNAVVTVSIIDMDDDISDGSGYAHHNIGGILRNVMLVSVPADYATRLHVNTDFDASFTNATLKIWAGMAFTNGTSGSVEITLRDPSGNPVTLSPSSIALSATKTEDSISIPVVSPAKWDAEHPRLYTITYTVKSGGTIVETVTRKIGFRKLTVTGVRMYVNGSEVKLRGGCMHSVHPLLGRVSLDSLAERDVLLYKNANINFIRTSHYPPIEKFLEMCDKYGIYVEDEAAVCFLGTFGGPAYSSTVAKDTMFMEQFGEQIESHRSHPSVVIWSLGNESVWGSNFQLMRDYVRIEDPSRPVINSNSGPALSTFHYPGWDWKSPFSTSAPELWEEYAHVSCYNIDELKRDPNTRNFWGETAKRFWENMYPLTGCLGGAIWGTIDDVFLLWDWLYATGYGEWGIFDIWRREKPEYWLTKKAYSPIRIANAPLAYPGSGTSASIQVKNWFCHTNLNEVRVDWSLRGSRAASGSFMGPDLAPGAAGTLQVPTGACALGDKLHLKFVTADSIAIDEFDLTFGSPQITFPAPGGSAPTVSETASQFVVTGSNFTLVFSKTTGMIAGVTAGGTTLITNGPVLNAAPVNPGNWTLSSISVTRGAVWTTAVISGSYGSVQCTFTVKIDGNGLIRTTYSKNGSTSGNDEIGVSYELASSVDTITWERRGLWDYYPADHIGRTRGIAPRYFAPAQNQTYRQAPTWPWSMDIKSFFMFGGNDLGCRGTNDFRSQKENIYYAWALFDGSLYGIRVESDGNDAIRMEKGALSSSGPSGVVDDRSAAITYTGAWTQQGDGNDWAGTESYSNAAGATAQYVFTGTTIAVIGKLNYNEGYADVYLDGVLAQQNVDCYTPTKIYQQTLFFRNNLTNAQHTIKIVVKGTRNTSSSDTYVILDGFLTQDPGAGNSWKMILNNQWQYKDGYMGNYLGSLSAGAAYTDSVSFRLMPRDSQPVVLAETHISRRMSGSFAWGRMNSLSISREFVFYVPNNSKSVALDVFSLDGKRLLTRELGILAAGCHRSRFNDKDKSMLGKSVYVYRIRDRQSLTKD